MVLIITLLMYGALLLVRLEEAEFRELARGVNFILGLVVLCVAFVKVIRCFPWKTLQLVVLRLVRVHPAKSEPESCFAKC